MSLIKAVDVPKHLAERMRSRQIAARLSSGAKKAAVPGTKSPADPPLTPAISSVETASGLLPPAL
jgi:hypothetical protein